MGRKGAGRAEPEQRFRVQRQLAQMRPLGTELSPAGHPIQPCDPATTIGTMGGQTVRDFNELVGMLRTMRGQMVEAAIFLPWDDSRYAVGSFSGVVQEVRFEEQSLDPRWVLSWAIGTELPSEVAIWERRFIRAELAFTGDADESLATIDEPGGQNIFLKIYSEGWILDLISYV